MTGLYRAGKGRFVALYPSGVTLLGRRVVVIARWRDHVPAELKGWRMRVGPLQVYARKADS